MTKQLVPKLEFREKFIEVTRRIEFDTAHRVVGHQFKCKYIHGHRFILEVTFGSKKLDDIGMVVDFGLLKKKIKKWTDEFLDHNVILHKDDKELGDYISSYTGQSVYYLEANPTVENIALHIKNDIIPILFVDCSFEFSRLRLYESPNCFVDC